MAGRIDRAQQAYEQFNRGDTQSATQDWREGDQVKCLQILTDTLQVAQLLGQA